MTEEAFVIMRIGNATLDKLWRDIYAPSIRECGLDPKRVDKHNEGRLLSSEIAEFIKKARIIIADLTNERPNCYLEVGYAMGIGKFTNLILCAKMGENVHFDLSGYELIRWSEDKLELFKNELIKKIRYRLKLLHDIGTRNAQETEDFEEWLNAERKTAIERFKKMNIGDGYTEVVFRPIAENKIIRSHKEELIDIAKKAECHNTGWPIGVVLDNRKEFKPQKVDGGIKAIIDAKSGMFGPHFDYWMLKCM